MDKIEEYYIKLKNLIEEARADGVDIFAYTSFVGENNGMTIIDKGISVETNAKNGGKRKNLSTWDN